MPTTDPQPRDRPRLLRPLCELHLYTLRTSSNVQDFSLSFLIYLLITFLVHLYQNTGKNASAQTALERSAPESGYAKLDQRGDGVREGPETYELSERDMDLNTQLGDDDATKIGTEDELDWVDTRSNDRVRI